MRGTLNFMWSNARSKQLAVHPDLPVPVEIHAVRSARRLRLRFDERRRVLKLTCPIRTSRRAALAWAALQRAWVDTQIANALPGEPFAPGATIPIEGRKTRLVWSQGEGRTPRLVADELRCGAELIACRRAAAEADRARGLSAAGQGAARAHAAPAGARAAPAEAIAAAARARCRA